MSETLTERLTNTEERMRLYQQERAILEVTELISQVMDEQNVNRSELARRIGKTKGYITQLLDGRTNMTVRTISDIFTTLNRALHFQEGPLDATVSAVPLLTLDLESSWSEQAGVWPGSMFVSDGPQANRERQAI